MEDSDINDNASIEIMNYLIKKLESTYNSILKFNNLLDSYDTSESFFTLRKDLKLFFTDLTENFNQGIFAIKALKNQNKKILEEMKIKEVEHQKNIDQLNNIITENKKIKTEIKNNEENFIIKENNIENIKDNNIENIKDNNINIDKKEELNENNNNINNNIIINKKEENLQPKNNKFELQQLSNVRNIMDNMKKNKMRVKMIIGQHFINNQDNQNINDN